MSTRPYVTVYKPVAGWKAILVWWNPEGFWEPWDTSYFAYGTKAEAMVYARDWAQQEGIEYKEDAF